MVSSHARVLPVLLLAATLAGLVSCSAATPQTAPPPRTPGQTVVGFYGDSYTRGTGASAESARWSTLVSEERGWAEFNPSVDGLGFVNNREALSEDLVELIIAEKPDIVIVTMGLNDNFSLDNRAPELEAAITEDLETFAEELPDSRLVVVEPFWYTDERPRSVNVIIDWVERAAESVGADFVPGASRWLEGHPEWMAPDGIHPNDEGYAEIAERMNSALGDLGL